MRRLASQVTLALVCWFAGFALTTAPAYAQATPATPEWRQALNRATDALFRQDRTAAQADAVKAFEEADRLGAALAADAEEAALQWIRLGILHTSVWLDEAKGREWALRCYERADKLLGANSKQKVLVTYGRFVVEKEAPYLLWDPRQAIKEAQPNLAALLHLAVIRAHVVRHVGRMTQDEAMYLPLPYRFASFDPKGFESYVAGLEKRIRERSSWPIQPTAIPLRQLNYVATETWQLQDLPKLKASDAAQVRNFATRLLKAHLPLAEKLYFPYSTTPRNFLEAQAVSEWRSHKLENPDAATREFYATVNQLENTLCLSYIEYLCGPNGGSTLAYYREEAQRLIPRDEVLDEAGRARRAALIANLDAGYSRSLAYSKQPLEMKLDFTVSATPTPRPVQQPTYERPDPNADRVTCDVCRGRGVTEEVTSYSNAARVTCWRCKGKGWRSIHSM